mmetsp:Transcript_70370/g.223014  ORF Transcript_70370/g.223014 Transcript_70370/m.223014 type:complete len:389 (-) Transcript_70370:208-1374(-)|eukprot:CAMPEP_0182894968 /NCGR_PEP_ID=MMETSP0034_2-20130328/25400_1 /TAXON_ID=156128 /ORGANISM="Nephroselmis pyriformis, Strain CCMP717" /LENGTH=388 /DNA_ID=CAMNT_0025028773 /DNA_START=58 /DNA_END=1224 /DNA_ORIENTATION=-
MGVTTATATTTATKDKDPSHDEQDVGDHSWMEAPYAHLLLLAVMLAPLAVQVPTNLNIVLTAVVTVYVGCYRSVKPSEAVETMTKSDAMRFPFVGSAVLFGLFVLFKYLPKELVNAVLTAYFVLLGTLALTATFQPFIRPMVPAGLREKTFSIEKFRIPLIMSEPTELSASVPEIVGACLALPFCIWYYMKKHWLANNMLGIAFSVQGIEFLSLGTVQIGCILLGGLFFYDIFWVFCTPVMVTVAKSFDAPIKLLFPRWEEPAEGSTKTPMSMLGLGDIVIPGIFVALILRYDLSRPGGQLRYFCSAFGGYAGGLAATIVVMNVFKAAQPALLYIVPAVLGAVGVHAWIRGEVKDLLAYNEGGALAEAMDLGGGEESEAKGVEEKKDE